MSSSEEGSWISWFCGLQGNEFFCEIEKDYIDESFNRIGLEEIVPWYRHALDMVLDLPPHAPREDACTSKEAFVKRLEVLSAPMLYGFMHARYIMTERGLDQMIDKWQHGDFGQCPRVYCENQNVLPIGLTDQRDMKTVKVYCPKCQDIYKSKLTRYKKLDGAYFGTGFPHMLFIEHPELRPERPANVFVPRLYGFKIHPEAYKLQDAYTSKSSRYNKLDRAYFGAGAKKAARKKRKVYS